MTRPIWYNRKIQLIADTDDDERMVDVSIDRVKEGHNEPPCVANTPIFLYHLQRAEYNVALHVWLVTYVPIYAIEDTHQP